MNQEEEGEVERIGRRGFTLIELSIVLVILGLIVGGVLVGQDLIRAAGVRAQISQIEKYNTAVNTFRVKYGYLPGDIPAVAATQFGFAARGPYAGEGDGNGIIEGIYANAASNNIGYAEDGGETTAFWVDLSTAGLIDGTFNTATPTGQVANISQTGLSSYFPSAKLGQGNIIYVWSQNTQNYFGLSAASSLSSWWILNSTPGLSVQQAYQIDKKMDDGLPQSGRVIATYNNNGPFWAGTGIWWANPYTTATSASTATCFDNGNSAGAAQQYSLAISNGSNVNCALSFQFQ